MKLHDREVKMAFNVGAMQDISRLCPDNDIRKIDTVFDFDDESRPFDFGLVVRFAAILSSWGEKQYAYEHPGYEPRPFTTEELNLLQPADINELFAEAMRVMRGDSQQTVETEPERNPKKD